MVLFFGRQRLQFSFVSPYYLNRLNLILRRRKTKDVTNASIFTMQHFSLRRFNNCLAVVTIGVCIYTAALPLIPIINFWLQNSAGHFKTLTTPTNLLVKLSTDRADINTL